MTNLLIKLAAATKEGGINVDLPERTADEIVANMLNLTYVIVGILSVIFIVIGASWYITAVGNPEKITRGRNTIIGAVAGVVLAMLAFAITNFVLGTFE